MSDKFYRVFWLVVLFAAFLFRLSAALYWDSYVDKRAKDRASTTARFPNQRESISESAASSIDKDGPFFFGDSDSYWKLARAVAFHRPYEFDPERKWQVFRTPGYPVLLAPLFLIFGENPPVLAARFEGIFFGLLNVLLVGALALRLFKHSPLNRPIAILAALFTALDPTLVLQSVCVLSEEPFLTFALLVNLSLMLVAERVGLLSVPNGDVVATETQTESPRKKIAIPLLVLAFSSVATIYIRPSWLYYLPFAACCLVAYRTLVVARFSRNRAKGPNIDQSPSLTSILVKTATLSLAVVALTFLGLSPWIYRNMRLTGQFVVTSLQTGASLYDGLNPNADGGSDMSFVDDYRTAEKLDPSAPETVHFEVRLDNRLKQDALRWAKENPATTIKLALVKFYRLWAPVPREPAFSKPILKATLALSYLPIFCLGILGAIRSFRRNGNAWFLMIPAAYISALHTIFVSSIRYRTPVMTSFAILAAYWLITTLAPRLQLGKRE